MGTKVRQVIVKTIEKVAIGIAKPLEEVIQ